MFSQFLTIVTSLAMLWHSIGGCCWHHDHQDCDAGTAVTSAGVDCHPPGTRPHFHFHHDHGAAHHSEGEEPLSPAPCEPSQHCTGETCVYVKSVSLDVTGLFCAPAEFVSPVTDVLAAQASAALLTTDRVNLHREELSSQHRCALTQSWLL